jgi:hypothetical protein
MARLFAKDYHTLHELDFSHAVIALDNGELWYWKSRMKQELCAAFFRFRKARVFL